MRDDDILGLTDTNLILDSLTPSICTHNHVSLVTVFIQWQKGCTSNHAFDYSTASFVPQCIHVRELLTMAVKCGLLESRVVHISLLIAPLTIEPPAAPELSDRAFRTRLLDTYAKQGICW